MQQQDMLRMANQIASFFNGSGPEAAVKDAADHISKFWDPRMRSSILARVEAGEPMDDLLRAGVELHRQGEIDRSEVAEPSGG